MCSDTTNGEKRYYRYVYDVQTDAGSLLVMAASKHARTLSRTLTASGASYLDVVQPGQLVIDATPTQLPRLDFPERFICGCGCEECCGCGHIL